MEGKAASIERISAAVREREQRERRRKARKFARASRKRNR